MSLVPIEVSIDISFALNFNKLFISNFEFENKTLAQVLEEMSIMSHLLSTTTINQSYFFSTICYIAYCNK